MHAGSIILSHLKEVSVDRGVRTGASAPADKVTKVLVCTMTVSAPEEASLCSEVDPAGVRERARSDSQST